MFSMDEIDNAENNRNKIPSGIMDNTEFVTNMYAIYNLISKTDFSDEKSRTQFNLHIINMFADEQGNLDQDRCLNTVINLCSHIHILFQAISEDKDNYLFHYKELILNKFSKNSTDEPYYD
jgi:hypothetical protein